MLFLVGIYLLREPLIHPGLARLVATIASSDDGMQVALEDIDSDWIGKLGVRGVRISGGSGQLREASIDRLELRFSLWTLLLRRDLTGISSVALEGGHASIDLTAVAPVKEPGVTAWPTAPASFPAIQARGLALDLRLQPDLLVGFEQLEIDSTGTPTARELMALSPRAHLSQADSRWDGPVQLSLSLSPEQLRIEELRAGSHGIIGPSTLDWSRLTGGRLDWDASLADGQLRSEGSLVERELTGSLHIERADLADWMHLLPAPINSLGARLDGSVDFALDLDDPLNARASAEMDVQRISFRETAVDRLAFNASLEAGALRVGELNANQGEANEVQVTDLQIPLQAGDLGQTLVTSHGALTFVLRDLSRLPLGAREKIPQHHIEGRGRIEDGRITLEGGQLTVPGGSIQIETASVDLATSELDQRALQVEAAVDIADLGQLDPILGTSNSSGSLEGHLTLSGTLASPEGEFAVTGQAVNAAGLPLGVVELRAQARNRSFQLELLHCVGDMGTLDASGAYRADSGRFENFTLEARIVDLEPLGLSPEFDLKLVAPARLRADLDGPWRIPSGNVELDAPATSIGGHPLETLMLKAQFASGSVEVEQLGLSSPWAVLVASGAGTYGAEAGSPIAISLDTLSLERGGSKLALSQPVTIQVDGPGISCGEAQLAGSAGSVTFEASRTPDITRARASAKSLDLTEFLAPQPVSLAGIDGLLEFESVDGDLRLTSTGSIDRIYQAEMLESLRATWDASLGDGSLHLEALRIESDGASLASLDADIPIDLSAPMLIQAGALRIDGNIDVPQRWTEQLPLPEELGSLAGGLRGELHLAGERDELRGSFRCEGTDLVLSGPAVAEYFRSPASLTVDLVFEDSVEATLSADLPGLAEVEGGGNLQARLDLSSFLANTAQAVDAWRVAPIDAHARVEIGSLADATRSLETIRRLDGRLEADLKVSGTLAAPTIDGDASLADGALKFSQGAPPLEQLNATLHFDGHSVELVDVRAEMGAAPVTLGGEVNWAEKPVRLDLRIQGEELLMLRSPSARLRADTDLHLAGPLDQLHLSGRLGLRASRILQEIDLLPRASSLASGRSVRANSRGFQLLALREPPYSNMTLDLEIDTVDPLLLTTNVASSSWAIQLQILGTAGVPLPQGEIRMADTRLILPGGVMTFESGRMTFSRENPFIPTLEMRGETRLAGYDVSMHVTGPYDAPEAVLSSSPPLAHTDLLLLILTGSPPADGGRSASRRAAQSVTLYLAKDILQRMRSSSLDDDPSSILDRLEIIQGREVSKSGSQTTEASFRLQEAVWSERDAFYLVADRDLYEEYNLGLRIVLRFQ